MYQLLALVEIGKEFWLKPSVGAQDVYSGLTSLGELISAILPNVYVIASLILFFLLFLGGFGFLINAGKDPEEMNKASKSITIAILGFLIIFASYWIIQIIEILTGINIL